MGHCSSPCVLSVGFGLWNREQMVDCGSLCVLDVGSWSVEQGAVPPWVTVVLRVFWMSALVWNRERMLYSSLELILIFSKEFWKKLEIVAFLCLLIKKLKVLWGFVIETCLPIF